MPVVTAFDDDTAEAEAVAAALLDRSEDGVAWSDQAVLARTHDQLATVARALARVGIPHHTAPGPESPESTEPAAAPGRAGRDRRAGNAVELATFHRAKGLEWESVHVIGLEEGFVPIVYAESSEARDEERRLLYVALTRASRDLHCSWARSRRMANGRQMDRQPSPWLAPVARVSRAGTGRVPRRDTEAMIAEMRAGLGR
jgi:superfamily I DNA/RNA helicase